MSVGIGLSDIFGSYVAAQTYKKKILAIESASLIALWPLDETAGATADNAEGSAARDGSYTGVTLNHATGPDGVNGVPLFDGVNDYVDVYNASWMTSVLDGDNLSFNIWIKMTAGVWTDATNRYLFVIEQNAGNKLSLRSPVTNNTLSLAFSSGAITRFKTIPSSTYNWFCLGFTHDQAGNEFKVYLDGAHQGPAQAGGNAWVDGGYTPTACLIGAATTTPTSVHSGYLAYPTIWTTVLTEAQMLKVATV